MMDRNYKTYMRTRREGFGMNLYRNTKAKKLGGVCAGIADHFEIDHNIARIVFIAALLFTSFLAFWAYLIAWIVLVPKEGEQVDDSYEYSERERRHGKKKMFRSQESTSERLQRAKARLDSIAARVQGIEQYVTSRKYNLNKQFADLEK